MGYFDKGQYITPDMQPRYNQLDQQHMAQAAAYYQQKEQMEERRRHEEELRQRHEEELRQRRLREEQIREHQLEAWRRERQQQQELQRQHEQQRQRDLLRFGAIAYSAESDSCGFSWGQPDWEAAQRAALSKCGDRDAVLICKGCNVHLALAVGQGGCYGSAWHSDAMACTESALARCRMYDRFPLIRVLLDTRRGELPVTRLIRSAGTWRP